MWARLRQPRLQRRIGLAITATALITLTAVLATGGSRSDRVSMWISAISAVISACAFAADLLRDPAPDPTPTTDRRQRAADELADAVDEQWSTEFRRRRLQDPAPLDIHWTRVGPPLADHPHNIRGGLSLPVPRDGDQSLDRIVETFREPPSSRVVVLGEPGAGKTVLAIRFVLAVLEGRQAGAPVPVLFSLAGWDPEAADLREWLAERLAAEYRPLAAVRAERTLARELLDAGLILPVLDGFDELPAAAHPRALERLNAGLDDRLPVLLTCRTAVWEAAVCGGADVLTSAEVVRLRPLDRAAAEAYLRSTARSTGERDPDGDRDPSGGVNTGGDAHTVWSGVLPHASPPLTAVLRSPLMVTLARRVYGDTSRDPSELNDTDRFPTPDAIEKHLLDAFVPAAFADGTSPWSPESADRWLRRLARELPCHRPDDSGTGTPADSGRATGTTGTTGGGASGTTDGTPPGTTGGGASGTTDGTPPGTTGGTTTPATTSNGPTATDVWRLAWWELPAAMPPGLRVLGPALLALLATATLLVPLAVYGRGVVANWDSPLSAVLNFAGILVGLCFGLARLLPATARSPQGPRQLARMALTMTAAGAVVAVALGVLAPPLVGGRLGAVLTSRPTWFLNGCCFGLSLSMMFAVGGLSRRPLPLGLPWAYSPAGPRAVRALGGAVLFAGLAICGYFTFTQVVPALTCLVAGLLLLLAGARRGERAAGQYTTPAAVLRAFRTGLLRGLLACTLIGTCAGAVVGGITGAFAAYEIHSADHVASGGWHLQETGGNRSVRSTQPRKVLLVRRTALAAPFVVYDGARISYDREIGVSKGSVRIYQKDQRWVFDWHGEPSPRAGREADEWKGEPVDAHNLVVALPHDVEVWLVRRSVATIVCDAMRPLVGFGLLVGLIGGCASGVYRALNTPSDTIRAAGPRSTLRTDRAATLVRSAIAALLAGGVCLVLISASGRGTTLGSMHTEVWVQVGTNALALSAWGRLGAARIWLALTGRAPWRLMRFLKEAHRRGVLRQWGAHYEFSHLRLQQRLAADETATDARAADATAADDTAADDTAMPSPSPGGSSPGGPSPAGSSPADPGPSAPSPAGGSPLR
ncbi:NACHT domain-containing protein [Streptomyces sp. CA-210063]|uniref:NACHT domain-containing protein n=1 Tax=Streptomyces sp. CA-210063 TaxID=2801029 RepID=UPI00214B7EA6|nr:NACHT domain-containing protein [Streptomyces sp. CA-210063]UUU32886.1 NACHT domain-containing protein [Streptomyces sp. CA-210063]